MGVGTNVAYFKNSWVVNSAKHILGVGTNVAYFKNQYMITKMASCSPTFERFVMKFIDTLLQGLVSMGMGSRSLETLTFSTLSYWKNHNIS